MIKTKVGKLSASGIVGQVSVGTMSGYRLNDIKDLFGVHHPRTIPDHFVKFHTF